MALCQALAGAGRPAGHGGGRRRVLTRLPPLSAGLPFKASVDDVLKFYQGFTLATGSVYLRRHTDGRLNGEVRSGKAVWGGRRPPTGPLDAVIGAKLR